MVSDPPARLGRYEILQELGRGAMGVVYLAWDPLIGRSVAIKTFRAAMADDDPDLREFRTRFMREAQSAGILSHPNIVTIHDVVEGNEGSPSFIAMEYVEGTDLKEVLRHGGRLSMSEVVETISQVASALDYAHAKGVIHRDIKPANIILDRDGRVKITDFGIARFETSDLTQDGQLLGTPNYMAPERIQGGAVDHRTDIFSLGVVLYEMLTGRKPFQGDSLTTVSHRIVYEPFTPLDALVPGLPGAAVAVITRALAKKPEDRYSSAGELAVDLQLALVPALNFELPPSPWEGAEEPDSDLSATQDVSELAEVAATGAFQEPVSRGHRFGLPLWVAAGALLMVLLAGTVAALWVRRPVAQEPAGTAARGEQSSELQGPSVAAHRELEAGRVDLAAWHLLRAVAMAPGDPGLVDLQRRVALELRERSVRIDQELHLLELLALAQERAASGRHEETLAITEELLALDPESSEGLILHDQAMASLDRQRRAERQRQQALAPQPAGATEPGPEVEAESAPMPAEEVEAAEGTVVVSFFTELPEGVFTLYAGPSQVLRERFAFYERTRFLRNEPRAGRIDGQIVLASGATTFRAYVAPTGQPAQLAEVEGRVRGGGEVTLRIHLAADGSFSAWLEP